MLDFADEIKDWDFVRLYWAMRAFDNSPIKCSTLANCCEALGLDYDRLHADLLAFDCHSDRDTYKKKVDAKTRRLARMLNVELRS